MPLWVQITITLLVGAAGAVLALRLKIPAGGIVGSMVFVAVFQVLTGMAVFPWQGKTMAQAVAGAFVAVPITLEQVKSFRQVIKPACIVVSGMLLGSVALGLAAWAVSDMLPITAFLAAATGGLQDIALLSADLGANQLQVSVVHILRVLVVISLSPVYNKFCARQLEARWPRRYPPPEENSREKAAPGKGGAAKGSNLALTLAVALAAGWLGYFSGMPAGALVFSLVAVCAFNLATGRAYMPLLVRRMAQVCAGALIGAGVTRESVAGIFSLWLPALIILAGYFLLNIALGLAVYHSSALDLRTSLFATTAAGVSDMALIADELDGDGPKVALLQTARLVATVTIFPTVFVWLDGLLV